MKNIKLTSHVFVGLLFVMYLPISLCGICELCVCTESEDFRIVDCRSRQEIDNYTEIFDLLAFERTENVKKLLISKQEITALPLDAFRGFKRLESLDLSENLIDAIESNIFKDPTNLRELDFSFNQLKTLSGDVFTNIRSLEILNLSNNLINDLNETTANHLPKLWHLDLSNNNLRTVDNEFIKSLTNLRFLDVSFNNIDSLEGDALARLGNLSELRVTDNRLKIISEKDFPSSLRILSAGGNMISSLPSKLSQIRFLNVDDNVITEIPILSSWFRQLVHLNISGNSLTAFPNVQFDKLQILDLSRNDFSTLSRTLSTMNLPILETLIIDDNPIDDLNFVDELNLRNLYARRLQRIETIKSFGKLRGVDGDCLNLIISNNPRLSRIEEGALNDMEICSLDLSENAFTRISPEVIKSINDTFVAERGIDFQGNPFNCDCEAQWMLDDLVPHLYKVNPELLENLRCAKPSELSGARMVHWLKWRKPVFCDSSARMLLEMRANNVLAINETPIKLESSRAMLAITAGAMGILCIMIILGLLIARKLEVRKRRMNRRF